MNEEFRLDKIIEMKGHWWLPENEKFRLYGDLVFTPKELITLNLLGNFILTPSLNEKNEITISSDQGLEKIEIVLGIANGRKVTLYKCIESSSKKGFSNNISYQESIINSSLLFINMHFKNSSEIKFKNIVLSFSNLYNWLKVNLIKLSNIDDNITCSFKNYLKKEYEIDENFKLLFEWNPSFSRSYQNSEEYFIKAEPIIRLEFKEEVPFENYLYEKIFQIRNFLTLAIGNPLNINYLVGENESNTNFLQNNQKIYEPIYIMFHYDYDFTNNISPVLIDKYQNFKYSDIIDNFSFYLKNWFEKDEILSRIIDLFFGTIYNKNLSLEIKFLSLIIVLEGYHRIIYGNETLPPEEHEKRINRILSSVSKEDYDWLKKELEYSNEPSLRQRLKNILYDDELSDAFSKFIKDKDKFINEIVNLRNYFVHYNKNLKEPFFSKTNLYKICNILRKIFEICLLKEIGFKKEKIEELINRKNIKYLEIDYE